MLSGDNGSASEGGSRAVGAGEAARRVVVGTDGTGRSVVIEDAATATVVRRPNGAVVQEIWRQDAIPARVDDSGTHADELVLAPPTAGLVVRTYTCPPDSDTHPIDTAAAESIYGLGNAGGATASPGMHKTPTLDVITVVKGEIWSVLESGEVRLSAGDSLVVRGQMHAWSNRTNSPAVLVSTVVPLGG